MTQGEKTQTALAMWSDLLDHHLADAREAALAGAWDTAHRAYQQAGSALRMCESLDRTQTRRLQIKVEGDPAALRGAIERSTRKGGSA